MPKKFRGTPSSASTREDTFWSARDTAQPLAARMRPRTLEEFVGQEHLLASGKALRSAIETGNIKSMVFWGPPGSGKTTLGRLIAQYTDREFVPFSAVTEGQVRRGPARSGATGKSRGPYGAPDAVGGNRAIAQGFDSRA